MTNTDRKEKHTHSLPEVVKVTCEGKAYEDADLRPGMRVRVTTEDDEPNGATGNLTLDNNRDFENGA